jgi:hypothetical protein
MPSIKDQNVTPDFPKHFASGDQMKGPTARPLVAAQILTEADLLVSYNAST